MVDQNTKEEFDNLSTNIWKAQVLFETLNTLHQNMELSLQINKQNCINQNSAIETVDENFANLNGKKNQNDTPTTISGNLEKK